MELKSFTGSLSFTSSLLLATTLLVVLPGANTARAAECHVVEGPISKVSDATLDIFDAVQAERWHSAAARLSALKRDARRSHAKLDAQKQHELDDDVSSLSNAVGKKDRGAALEAANKISLLTAQASYNNDPAVPFELDRIDYLTRELRVAADERDDAKLHSTAAEISDTWNHLKPRVIEKHGSRQAQRFDESVRALGSSATTQDYLKAGHRIAAQLDGLERVFKK